MENSAKNLARFFMNVKFWERGFKYEKYVLICKEEKVTLFKVKLFFKWYKFG